MSIAKILMVINKILMILNKTQFTSSLYEKYWLLDRTPPLLTGGFSGGLGQEHISKMHGLKNLGRRGP